MRQRPPVSSLFPYTTLFRSQEQVLDLLHGVRRGLRFMAALGDVGVQELQGRLFVAAVGQHGLADAHGDRQHVDGVLPITVQDRKSTRLNSSHSQTSYAVFPV